MGRKKPDQLVELAQEDAVRGDLVGAETRYRAALDVAPDHIAALTGLGVLLVERGQPEEAIELLERAREIVGDFSPIHSALCTAYADAGDEERALAAAETAVKLESTSTIPLMQLARLHIRGNRRLEAIGAVRRVLRRDPAHAQARYLLAGMTGDKSFDVSMPPPEIVADLFDRYARSFDEHLVGTLQYAGPQQIAALLGTPEGAWKIVDLGCGTGLAGVALRPFARELIGGDLSWKMVALARARGIYDALYAEDLLATLARVTEADLVVAADVFVYVGTLDAVFAGTARTLRAGGRFAFTVETHAGDGFELQTSLRYAHGEAYIRGLAAAHGFGVDRAEPTVLRLNDGAPIHACCYLLRRA